MSTAVLFVTRDAGIVPPGLAKNSRVTDSVEDALNLCASASFGAVFCDAASLADGGSGFRLGRQMRRNGISIPLFLMTNSILSSMEGVAAASGATGSISRTATAILEALQRDVAHLNAVRLALERARQDSGQPPPVALVLPEHVARRDAPVRPHDLGSYDRRPDQPPDPLEKPDD